MLGNEGQRPYTVFWQDIETDLRNSLSGYWLCDIRLQASPDVYGNLHFGVKIGVGGSTQGCVSLSWAGASLGWACAGGHLSIWRQAVSGSVSWPGEDRSEWKDDSSLSCICFSFSPQWRFVSESNLEARSNQARNPCWHQQPDSVSGQNSLGRLGGVLFASTYHFLLCAYVRPLLPFLRTTQGQCILFIFLKIYF